MSKLSQFLTFGALLLAFVTTTNTQWTMNGANGGHTNSVNLNVPPVSAEWGTLIRSGNANLQGPSFSTSVGPDGTLYVAMAEPNSVNFSAFSPKNGASLWSLVIPVEDDYKPTDFALPLIVHQAKAGDINIYLAFDSLRGYEYNFFIYKVIVPNGELMGKIGWTRSFPQLWSSSNIALNIANNSIVLYGGSCETCMNAQSYISSIDCTTGFSNWIKLMPNETTSSQQHVLINETDGSIYLATSQQEIIKYSQEGQVLWTFTQKLITSYASFSLSPAYNHLVGSYGNYFYALDTDTGKYIWQTPIGDCQYVASVPSFDSQGNSYFSCSNLVMSLSSDGKVRWISKPIGDEVNFSFQLALPPLNSSAAGGVLYFIPSLNPPAFPPETLCIVAIDMSTGAYLKGQGANNCYKQVPVVGTDQWYTTKLLHADYQRQASYVYVVQALNIKDSVKANGYYVNRITGF